MCARSPANMDGYSTGTSGAEHERGHPVLLQPSAGGLGGSDLTCARDLTVHGPFLRTSVRWSDPGDDVFPDDNGDPF